MIVNGGPVALAGAADVLAAAIEAGRAASERARHTCAGLCGGRPGPGGLGTGGLGRAGIGEEEIERLDRAADGPDAPPELRAIADRVRRGELSWRQIVAGEAMHDPGVQAAVRVTLAGLGRIYRAFERGHCADDVCGPP